MISAPIRLRDTVRSIANEVATEFVDNYQLIPKSKKYFADNIHYTEKGARLVASNFAQCILKNYSQ
jgi:lysophospholipase L1-like esterase